MPATPALPRDRQSVRTRQDEALRLRQTGMNYTEIALRLGYIWEGRVIASGARSAVLAAMARTAAAKFAYRRYGVEMEVVGATREAMAQAISAALGEHVAVLDYHGRVCQCCGITIDRNTAWKVERDGSLRFRGSGHLTGEIVSPILQGEEGFRQIATVLEAVRAIGVTTNRSCGLHVHVEAADVDGDSLSRIVEFYATAQTEIDKIVSVSRRNNTYCRKVPQHTVLALKQAAAGQDHSGAVSAAANYASKYSVVNLSAFVRQGTIEFRQHQGTTNAAKVTAWVKFVQAIISASVLATDIDTSVELDLILDSLSDKGQIEADAARFLKSRQTALATR